MCSSTPVRKPSESLRFVYQYVQEDVMESAVIVKETAGRCASCRWSTPWTWVVPSGT